MGVKIPKTFQDLSALVLVYASICMYMLVYVCALVCRPGVEIRCLPPLLSPYILRLSLEIIIWLGLAGL